MPEPTPTAVGRKPASWRTSVLSLPDLSAEVSGPSQPASSCRTSRAAGASSSWWGAQ